SIVNNAISKAATSVANLANTAETTVATATAQAQASIGTAVTGAQQALGTGGPADAGIKEGQFKWNLYSYKRAPYQTRATDTIGSLGAPVADWCFRGSWTELDQLYIYGKTIDGINPPDWCYGPGGPAAAQPTDLTQGSCTVFELWRTPNTAGGYDCKIRCGPS